MPLTPFRHRDPLPLGIAGLVAAAALVAGALAVPQLKTGTVYTAAFAESAGLRPGEDVIVAGVKVGEVSEVELEGAHVRVGLRLEREVPLGSQTRAHIRLATLLGSHHVQLEPHGPGRLDRAIPIERTSVPYEIMPALGDLADSAARIDAGALKSALDTLAQTLDGSSEEIRASVRGLGRLSRTVASRDDKLHDLVRHAETVTGLVADRNQDLRALIKDGDLLLREISARRAVIHSLLTNTLELTAEIDGLIADNRTTLKPALRQLREFVGLLRRNEESLDRSLRLLAPFTRQFTDAVGNGRWFDAIVQNLVPLPASVQLPDRTLGGLAP
ncbi:MCE family protein [Nonomuraea endophytica]|uniref:Phospholipid/cholesterol/gamma-HCH transport system substrate-binding protein n=1 Tax=Nonomuraea endophytica TaxID=714136 RepID=A0A7W7ZWL5_9ACTN|nr:MCE family protein [Nonomuraea endophytica]MBB5075134.1 phospholipid/cholesterol/gamma-HCH transport system substrate-binding protein [Nonomuraea endophytica]